MERDEVHDVRVALDEHEVLDADGAEFGDAAYVVAAEVDEHDVLGDFLLVGAEVGFEGAVFDLVGGASAGAGDGAVLDRRSRGCTRTRSSGEAPTMLRRVS